MLRKFWFYTKEALKTTKGKAVVSLLIVGGLVSMFVIPTVLNTNSIDMVLAYNRDSNSGTYGVWADFLNKEDIDKWSSQTREVTGNDKMLANVDGNTNAIGYVSAESVDYHSVASDEKPVVHDNISNTVIIDFIAQPTYIDPTNPENNGEAEIVSASADNISAGLYGTTTDGDSLVRGFNQFWRGTPELDTLYFDEETGDDIGVEAFVDAAESTNATEQELGAWVFYNWTLYGESASELLTEASAFDPVSTVDQYTMTDEELQDIVEALGIDEISFTTVGSTSVNGSLNMLIHGNETVDGFEDIMAEIDVDVNINNSGHDGSGDAFKGGAEYTPGVEDDVKFNNPSMLIGYQSRSFKTEEADKWIYHDIYSINDQGEYEYGVHYQTYANDPLILLANEAGVWIEDENGDKKQISALSWDALYLLYMGDGQDFTWQSLYDYFLENESVYGPVENHVAFSDDPRYTN